jgi:hypothetical protein
MDGVTTTTLSKAKASAYRRRIGRLVRALEADGYVIGPNAEGARYWVKMPEIPIEKDVCGMMKLNMALKDDAELRAHLIPWLIRNRPFHEWQQRISRQPKRPRVVVAEHADFLPPSRRTQVIG